jgi:flavin-dependent dehydrogenase
LSSLVSIVSGPGLLAPSPNSARPECVVDLEASLTATQWDVLVVGGGPAGAAVALAQPPGRRVLVVDRRRAPWRKPCDGILTPMSRRALDALAAGVVENAGSEKAECLSVVDRDRHRDFTLALDDHVMVDRQAFDSGLRARLTARSDLAFLDQTDVCGWMNDGDRVLVRIRRKREARTLTARIVVDASGAAGVAGRSPDGGFPPTAVAVQLWYPPQGDRGRCDWIFDAGITPYYLWAIRKPAGLVLGGVFPLSAARCARPAVARLARSLDVWGSPWRVQGANMAMPRWRSDIRLIARGALVVGEAAGLINAATGEGISFALRSGMLCGRAIAASGRPADAADLYARAVAPLCEEAATKARHARDLFEPARRGVMPAERVLVPVPRLWLELPA